MSIWGDNEKWTNFFCRFYYLKKNSLQYAPSIHPLIVCAQGWPFLLLPSMLSWALTPSQGSFIPPHSWSAKDLEDSWPNRQEDDGDFNIVRFKFFPNYWDIIGINISTSSTLFSFRPTYLTCYWMVRPATPFMYSFIIITVSLSQQSTDPLPTSLYLIIGPPLFSS